MQQTLKMILVALAMTLGFAGSALAEDFDSHHRDGGRGWHERGGRGWHEGGWHRGHGRRGGGKWMLKIGICAGQKLSAQGITLPERKPGEGRPKLDDATRKAVFTNVQLCRYEFKEARRQRRGDKDKDDKGDDKAPGQPEDKDADADDDLDQQEEEEIVGAILDM